MNIFFACLLVTLTILLVFSLIIDYRNNKVYDLRKFVIDGTYNYIHNYLNSVSSDQALLNNLDEFNEIHNKVYDIRNKYTYEEMLFNIFKPLTLEKWYTKEEIEIITKFS